MAENKARSSTSVDSTRKELERAAQTHHQAQEHADGLRTRRSEILTSLKEAKKARKAARAELKLAEKAVANGTATVASLSRQLKTAGKLAAKTAGAVEVAERRHNDVLRKQAKRQEKDAARVAKVEAERSRDQARRERAEKMRSAEVEARESERRAVAEAAQHAADKQVEVEREAEQQREALAAQVQDTVRGSGDNNGGSAHTAAVDQQDGSAEAVAKPTRQPRRAAGGRPTGATARTGGRTTTTQRRAASPPTRGNASS